MNLRDTLLAIIATAVWGCNFIFLKWGVQEVPPLFLTFLRFVVTLLPIIFFIPRPSSSLKTVALYGLVMGSLQFGFLNLALKFGLSASLASLMAQLQSFITVALAVVFLHERPKLHQMLGAAISFAGIGVIASARWTPQELLPFGLMLLAVIFLSLSNIISRRAREAKPFSFVVWSSIFAAPPILAVSLLIEDHAAIWHALTQPSVKLIGSVLYIAWGSTLVGYGLWNVLLQRHPAATVVPFYLLVPVFGILSGVLVMGDQFTGATVWGTALIFAGLLLNVFGPWLQAKFSSGAKSQY